MLARQHVLGTNSNVNNMTSMFNQTGTEKAMALEVATEMFSDDKGPSTVGRPTLLMAKAVVKERKHGRSTNYMLQT